MRTNINIYRLPQLVEDNYTNIEQLVLELQKKYRERQALDTVELDWLDSANNWLDKGCAV